MPMKLLGASPTFRVQGGGYGVPEGSVPEGLYSWGAPARSNMLNCWLLSGTLCINGSAVGCVVCLEQLGGGRPQTLNLLTLIPKPSRENPDEP